MNAYSPLVSFLCVNAAVDPCASNPCLSNQTCTVVDDGANYECTPPGDSDFPWLPIVIAVGVALLFALLGALLYCCCRYCCVGGGGNVVAREVVKQAPAQVAQNITQAPATVPKEALAVPTTNIFRSEAVYTPGFQYPYVVVNDYPLEPGMPVDVMVPFVDGSVESHPAYIASPRPAPSLPPQNTGPEPVIVASLEPVQPRNVQQQPLILQEVDDAGRMTGYATGGGRSNEGLVIGDDTHVRYEFVNI
jgi:hypothetical protein